MNPEERHKLIPAMEDGVAKWLDDAGATYLREYEFWGIRFDFLIIKPSPCIIELGFHVSHKAKRELASRIAIAECFGPDIPVVAITTKEFSNGKLPHFDAVFDWENLPDLEQIRSVQPSETAREILEKGAPAEPEFTDEDEYLEQWAEVTSNDHLLSNPSFTEESLGASIIGEIDRDIQNQSRINPIIQKAVEELLCKELKFTITREVIATDKFYKLQVYQTSSGHRFEIRTISVSDVSSAHKAQELLADAWFLRASGLPPKNLIILMGGNEPTNVQHPNGGVRTEIARPSLKTINLFEGAGWRVFPWDFHKSKPLFLEYCMERFGE